MWTGHERHLGQHVGFRCTLWTEHDGHSGCGSLMWLSDVRDIGLVLLFFTFYGTILGCFVLDWWKGRL